MSIVFWALGGTLLAGVGMGLRLGILLERNILADRRRLNPPCRHVGVMYDYEGHRVWCAACGERLGGTWE